MIRTVLNTYYRAHLAWDRAADDMVSRHINALIFIFALPTLPSLATLPLARMVLGQLPVFTSGHVFVVNAMAWWIAAMVYIANRKTRRY